MDKNLYWRARRQIAICQRIDGAKKVNLKAKQSCKDFSSKATLAMWYSRESNR